MRPVYRVYITTFRPPKADRAKRDAFGMKISYGVLIQLDGKEIGYIDSWVKTGDVQYAEMTALSNLLGPMQEREEFLLEIILNSNQLNTRLDQNLARLRKKQRNETASNIKKASSWEEFVLQYQLQKHKIRGMRERHLPEEIACIDSIKHRLKTEIYEGARLTGASPPEFKFEFPL